MTDDELLRAFEDSTLPFEQWTHRTHVKVAYLYLCRLPFEDALTRIRAGIKRYNAAKGVRDGPLTGYHETMTVAFTRIIHTTLCEYGPEVFPGIVDADSFCDTHPHLLQRSVLRLFYSRLDQQPAEAKTRFVEPNLAPLPRPRGEE